MRDKDTLKIHKYYFKTLREWCCFRGFYCSVNSKKVTSSLSVDLHILFPRKFWPSKRLTNAKCINFRQLSTASFAGSAVGGKWLQGHISYLNIHENFTGIRARSPALDLQTDALLMFYKLPKHTERERETMYGQIKCYLSGENVDKIYRLCASKIVFLDFHYLW